MVKKQKCEFCDETKYEKDYYAGQVSKRLANGGWTGLDIGKDYKGFYLQALGDGEGDKVYIKYCPFCGRKL